ncbi:oxidoreductase [Microlunatus elymi]|uniref:Oxidoreductase n=1 Tax=Microlunatus elymi TaxID=2596828 RepID=A0A516PXB0_9ACTN|nr:oxidoreductase [Microlunatus elymi]QDP95806.1 oxidoreductase [Microlunatus elymi]
MSDAARPRTPNAAEAGTWTLGDRIVNRIGFGAMRLTGDRVFSHGRPRDRAQALEVLRTAVELGVNHIDTAAFYFSALRSANELINSALAPYPDDLVIVTKVGPGRDPWGEWTESLRPDQLRGQVEENIRQLGLDQLDVVNFRRRDEPDVTEYVGALDELRQAGLIRHIGLSGVDSTEIAAARRIAPIVCVQNRFSLENRQQELEALRYCGEHRIAYVPFFAVSGSRATQPAGPSDHPDADRVIGEVAAAHDASAAQVRLAWILHQGDHVLAIPGTGSVEHLIENVAAARLRLTADEIARLDRIDPDQS